MFASLLNCHFLRRAFRTAKKALQALIKMRTDDKIGTGKSKGMVKKACMWSEKGVQESKQTGQRNGL